VNKNRVINQKQQSNISIILLIVMHSAVQILLHIKGFVGVSADEFARGINSAQWALNPRFDFLSDLNLTWLPFEKYLNGLFMILWPEPFWVPRITAFIFSCILLIAIFKITYHIFSNIHVSILTGLLVIFFPWFAWLSATPMLEIYYQAFFFSGFLFMLLWFDKGKKLFWIWAGLCFLIASSIHVQAWLQIEGLFMISAFFWLIDSLRQKEFRKSIELLFAFLLSNLFIFLLLINTYIKTGNPFDYFSRHTEYSKWFYQGYEVSFFERFVYYPRLVFESAHLLHWIFLLLAIYSLIKGKKRKNHYLLLSLAVLSLIISSVFNIYSVPATAAPNRYSMFYLILIAPYIGYSVFEIIRTNIHGEKSIQKFLIVIGVVGFIILLVWGGAAIAKLPDGLSWDSINTGYYIKDILDQDESKFMVELRYWEFLAVQMTAGHYSDIVFDREYILTERDKESVLLGTEEKVEEIFDSQGIKYLIIQDPEIYANVVNWNSFNLLTEIGSWKILQFSP